MIGKKTLDDGKIIGAVFMDLSRAFDCLPHSLLIAKLHAYGVTEETCQLLCSYLTSRKQRVKIGNYTSLWNTTYKGVPQGSILGPILFNVFINDLFFFMDKCQLYNYADDNSMSSASSNISDVMCNLHHDTANAIDWFIRNGMEPNPAKFQFMIISSKNIEKLFLRINENVMIPASSDVVLLGITIDEKLRFDKHVDIITKKAARQVNALSRISRNLDHKSKELINNSFVRSNFSYCPLVWHFCGKSANGKLEKLHERALRLVLNDPDSDYDDLLVKSGSSSLFTQRLRTIMVEIFKFLKKESPSSLESMFQIKEMPHHFRDGIKLIQPIRRTSTFGLRSISYLGPKLWNSLPRDLKKLLEANASTQTFKHALKSWNPLLCDDFNQYI